MPDEQVRSAPPRSRAEFFVQRAAVPGVAYAKRLALGTAALGGLWGEVDDAESIRTLHSAWADGFTLVDTAPIYGRAEDVISQALRTWSGPPPILCTKVGGIEDAAAFAIDRLTAQFARSRSLFAPHPISLLALHDAEPCTPALLEQSAEFLAQRVKEGSIIAAGIGGGGIDVQRRLIPSGIFRYVITYNRINAASLQGLDDLLPLAREHGVSLFAASPLAMGMLAGNLEDFQRDVPTHLAPFLPRARQFHQLAKDAGEVPADLALRFLLSMSQPDVVVSGPANEAEWLACRRAYDAGPLLQDLYSRICHIARDGPEPITGG